MAVGSARMTTTRINGKVSHRKIGEAVAVSLRNGQTTRSRVDHLEQTVEKAITVLVEHADQVAAHGRRLEHLQAVVSRPFLGRMRWLVMGQ